MSIAEDIKEMSHKISEGYLLFGKGVNDQIKDKYNSGEISNKEILKRVCELVNQNIYLSLFHKGDVDKSNISFDYADYAGIVGDVDKMEESMGDYSMAPGDFRMEHTAEQSFEKTAGLNDYSEKTASIHAINNFNNRIDSFVSNLESVEVDAIKTAEQSYIQMKSEFKQMNYNGETIDDVVKLATQFSDGLHLNTEKVASAYNLINKELLESGVDVNRGMTKIASQDINYDSEFFRPIEKLATAIDVIDAAKEMSYNISRLKVNGGTI